MSDTVTIDEATRVLACLKASPEARRVLVESVERFGKEKGPAVAAEILLHTIREIRAEAGLA